jgi:hypothetical protein
MAFQVSPLAQAINRSGLSHKRVDALCKKQGITRGELVKYAEGRSRPAPWLARAIAEAFGGNVDELFPSRRAEV